jgi:hypothetical protein
MARTVQGYTDAAKAFQEEAGLPKELLAAGSEERMHIRNAVEKGAVDEAIERVNDLNPEVRVFGKYMKVCIA